jgi:hypothetical protein
MPELENTTENTEVVEEDSSATDDLGEAGKKALAEERKARRALEKQLKEATDAAKAAQRPNSAVRGPRQNRGAENCGADSGTRETVG